MILIRKATCVRFLFSIYTILRTCTNCMVVVVMGFFGKRGKHTQDKDENPIVV